MGAVTALTLALPLGLIAAVYITSVGVRTLNPHLLLVAVLSFLAGRRWLIIPALLVAVNLLFWGFFQDEFTDWHSRHYAVPIGRTAAVATTLDAHITHVSDADPWCNTMLISTRRPFPPELAGVPLGIGLTVDLGSGFDGPIKSRWVLVEEPRLGQLPDGGEGLVEIEATPLGMLYRNPKVDCAG